MPTRVFRLSPPRGRGWPKAGPEASRPSVGPPSGEGGRKPAERVPAVVFSDESPRPAHFAFLFLSSVAMAFLGSAFRPSWQSSQQR